MARLQTAVLCNAASVEQSGLVSMLGAFIDSVAGPALPIRQQIWVVARLVFDPADVGVEQHLEVLVVPVDLEEGALPVPPPGQPLVRVFGTVLAEPTPGIDPRMLGGGPLVFPLPIVFPRVGVYHVTLSLQGELLWAAPLLVSLANPSA